MHQFHGENFYLPPDVARAVGCSPCTVRRYCERLFGRVPMDVRRLLTAEQYERLVIHLRAVEASRQEHHEARRRAGKIRGKARTSKARGWRAKRAN